MKNTLTVLVCSAFSTEDLGFVPFRICQMTILKYYYCTSSVFSEQQPIWDDLLSSLSQRRLRLNSLYQRFTLVKGGTITQNVRESRSRHFFLDNLRWKCNKSLQKQFLSDYKQHIWRSNNDTFKISLSLKKSNFPVESWDVTCVAKAQNIRNAPHKSIVSTWESFIRHTRLMVVRKRFFIRKCHDLYNLYFSFWDFYQEFLKSFEILQKILVLNMS